MIEGRLLKPGVGIDASLQLSHPTMSKERDSYDETHAPSTSSKQELDVSYDEAAAKRVIRKIDRHLLPFVTLLYLLSFLDRANIGNARLAGMGVDVNLTGLKYNVVRRLFFAL